MCNLGTYFMKCKSKLVGGWSNCTFVFYQIAFALLDSGVNLFTIAFGKIVNCFCSFIKLLNCFWTFGKLLLLLVGEITFHFGFNKDLLWVGRDLLCNRGIFTSWRGWVGRDVALPTPSVEFSSRLGRRRWMTSINSKMTPSSPYLGIGSILWPEITWISWWWGLYLGRGGWWWWDWGGYQDEVGDHLIWSWYRPPSA